MAGVYPKIMPEGTMDAGPRSCGMVAGLIHDLPTCKELIDRIMIEAESLITLRRAELDNVAVVCLACDAVVCSKVQPFPVTAAE